MSAAVTRTKLAAQPRLVAAGGFALLAVITLVDLAVPNRLAAASLIILPALAAAILPARWTAALAVAAMVLFAIAPKALMQSGQVHWVRMGTLLAIGGLAVAAALWRERLAAAAAQLDTERRDRERRHQEALELNDTVAQGLLAAYLTFQDRGGDEEAMLLLRGVLEAAQTMVRELLDDAEVAPGTFVRQRGSTIRRDI